MIESPLAVDTVRLALAILLDAGALVIWDIGTRSPVRLIADLQAGLRTSAVIFRGLVRLTIGAMLLVLGVLVSAPIANRPIDFTVVECWALVTALVLEQLVGPDLRARRRSNH